MARCIRGGNDGGAMRRTENVIADMETRIAHLEDALRDVVGTIECVVGDSTQCGDCVMCRARKVLDHE